jgi:hypothetical protein
VSITNRDGNGPPTPPSEREPRPMTRDELLKQPPTDEQIETSLRRIGTGKVRRCIPVDPDDDDVVLSNAIDHLRSRALAAEREAERQAAVIAGTAYPSDASLTREQAFHGWEVANRQRDGYARRAETAERSLSSLRAGVERLAAAQWWFEQWMSASMIHGLQSRARRVLRHRRFALQRRDAEVRALLGAGDATTTNGSNEEG